MVKQIGIFYNLVFFKFGISKKYLVFYYLDLAFFIFWYFKVLVFSGSAVHITYFTNNKKIIILISPECHWKS